MMFIIAAGTLTMAWMDPTPASSASFSLKVTMAFVSLFYAQWLMRIFLADAINEERERFIIVCLLTIAMGCILWGFGFSFGYTVAFIVTLCELYFPS
jgi:hypothetical protein